MVDEYLHKFQSHKTHKFPDFPSYLSSVQTHLDINAEDLPKAATLFAKIDFLRGLLFSNSPDFEFGKTLCYRDFLWAKSAFGICGTNTGAVDEEYKTLDDVAESFLPLLKWGIIKEKFSLNTKRLSPCKFAEIYRKFERLDAKWDECINLLKNVLEYKIPDDFDIALEQLFVYFVFRHLSDSLYEHNFEKRLSFCIHAVEFLSTIYFYNDKNINFNELCRMYSCEIEYSDENLNKLINLM